MNNHTNKWLFKICNFIILTILAGVIWELVHPIYIATLSAFGQAGNFFVNLYYSAAAKINTPIFIGFVVSALIGFFLAFMFRPMCNIFMEEQMKKHDHSQTANSSKSGLLDKIKCLSWVIALLGLLYTVVIFIYIMMPYQNKNYFDYKMTILQVVISPEQVKIFNARWCLMRFKKGLS